MTVKDSGTKRLRQSSKQSSFRKKSKSKTKDTQHVAHIVDLEIGTHISKKSKGKEATGKIAEVLNSRDNFRMVSLKTNLGEHKEVAKAIKKKAITGQPLTKVEEKRVKQQVKVLTENRKLLPTGFKKGAVKFYKKLKTKSGESVVDGRKLK